MSGISLITGGKRLKRRRLHNGALRGHIEIVIAASLQQPHVAHGTVARDLESNDCRRIGALALIVRGLPTALYLIPQELLIPAEARAHRTAGTHSDSRSGTAA